MSSTRTPMAASPSNPRARTRSRPSLRLLPALALGLLALAAPRAAAEVWVVGPPGPGVDFAQIGQAVSAAAEGDVILVRSGTYAGFTVKAKLLTIIQYTDA